jgi:AraC-like DNA-binding protein
MTDRLVAPTIPIAYLLEMAHAAPPRRVAAALLEAGLPKGALGAPRMRSSIVQCERFYRSLVRASGDELFGFFERPVPRGAYGVLVRLMAGCDDVTSMLDAAGRFYGLFDAHPYWALSVSRRDAVLALSCRAKEQARSIFFVHSMLLTPWRTAAWLAGRELPLDDISLPRRFRAFAGETRYLFGREPRFDDGPPRLRFRAELARLPIVRRAGEAGDWVRSSLRQILLAPRAALLDGRVAAILAEASPPGAVSLLQAAKQLGLSRAVLARELSRLGTSFQQVKDTLRRDHAIALLSETSLSVAGIAERLGYSEPSAFQRAFRAWTGLAPGAARAQRRR